MLAEVQVVGHGVKCRGVVFRKCGMGVLAMEALLEAIDPSLFD